MKTYSEEEVSAYEARYALQLPRLARIFLTRVSSSLMSLSKEPLYACIHPRDDYGYNVFDHDEVKISYCRKGEDFDKEDGEFDSRVVDAFEGRHNWLSMVVDGPLRGRVFDFSSESGIGSTEGQIDFFLNSTTPVASSDHASLSILARLFPGLRKRGQSGRSDCI